MSREMRFFFFFYFLLAAGLCAQESLPLPPRPLPPRKAPTIFEREAAIVGASPKLVRVSLSPQPVSKPAPPLHPMAVTEPKEVSTKEPSFVMKEPGLRNQPKSGYSVAVFGGLNPIPSGDWHFSGARVKEGNKLSATAGVKVGYTWPFDDEPIDPLKEVTGGLRLAGGLEAEGMWVRSHLKPKRAGVMRNATLDSGVFLLNFLLKGHAGRLRLYAGPGVGVASIWAQDYDDPTSTKTEDDTVALAVQGTVGGEVFVDDDWSVFGEYRFLMFHDVNLYDAPAELELDDLHQHLFTCGIRAHF